MTLLSITKITNQRAARGGTRVQHGGTADAYTRERYAKKRQYPNLDESSLSSDLDQYYIFVLIWNIFQTSAIKSFHQLVRSILIKLPKYCRNTGRRRKQSRPDPLDITGLFHACKAGTVSRKYTGRCWSRRRSRSRWRLDQDIHLRVPSFGPTKKPDVAGSFVFESKGCGI